MKLPKKSWFEKEQKYLKRIAKIFEDEGKLDPINAHYAALFFLRSKSFQLGDYRKGSGPDLIVRAINRMIEVSADVSNPVDIKAAIDALNKR